MKPWLSVIVPVHEGRDFLPATLASAADDDVFAGDRDHRGWRFRGNSRDIAVDELVEHHVADAQDRLLAEIREPLLEIEHDAAQR
mgnify:CR=1 FL=1